jgi:hypothetical protein
MNRSKAHEHGIDLSANEKQLMISVTKVMKAVFKAY